MVTSRDRDSFSPIHNISPGEHLNLIVYVMGAAGDSESASENTSNWFQSWFQLHVGGPARTFKKNFEDPLYYIFLYYYY